MTLAQKVGMLYPSGGSNLGGGAATYQQVTAAIPSLCVPSMILQGGIAGVRNTPAGTATQLPSPLAMAATFDRSLAAAYGTLEGEEAWAKGIEGLQAPYVNIARVPQDGRNSESWGEDPYLSSELTLAVVKGMQLTGVWSVVQSFAAYTQETNRQTASDNVIITDRVLREIYMPPVYATLHDGGAGGAMCTYPLINGVYSCQNSYLMSQMIKGEWGFAGFIRSDAGAVQDPVAAINAGIDFINPLTPATVTAAVQNGQIATSRIDDAVVRILTEMFRFGVFDRASTGTIGTNASTPEHVAAARAFAEQSHVLLKNTANILPLRRTTVGSIAVIGDDGGSGAVTAASGSAAVAQLASNIITPFQGIQAAAGPGVAVTYTPTPSDLSQLFGGAAAAAAAAAANVAIVFVGQPAGEGSDLKSLQLSNNQDALITVVAQANPNTVVVINSCNPVLMPWLKQVKGVIESWFPGQEDGNAIAALLFGDVDPSGKLPMTFPTSETASPVGTAAQWPGANNTVQYSEGLNVGYRGYEALSIPPLFPFGFGLSYTSFKISDLEVTPRVSNGTRPIVVQFYVQNTGSRTGAEVPQVYLGLPSSAGEPPKRLVGFDKVELIPGEKVKVQLTIDPAASNRPLSFWDAEQNNWSIANGAYQVYVGNSSENIALYGTIHVRR